ncbi:MAG: alpha/beta hydrolase [Proteobacteria bacterium]|nr:alpha/beta hydrolase [Pseudomonadota bacterium]
MSEQDFEERFRQPVNWQWGTMKNARGHDLRQGFSLPADKNELKGRVLYVMGVSEFAEKTFELARDFNKASYGFWVVDRFGQGMSGRYLSNKFKQHSEGFHHDVADITQFARETLPDDGAPVILLGHSTGGLIALMAAHDAPDVFAAASLTAPLMGLNRPPVIREREHLFAALPMPKCVRERFIPGGTSWRPRDEKRCDMPNEDYSGDALRMHIHDRWLVEKSELRMGSVTMGWVGEACRAMMTARDPEWLGEIKIPVHIFTAAQDRLINNRFTYEAAPHIPRSEMTYFPNGKHDLLMETDDIRDIIIAGTVALAGKKPGPLPG